MRHFLTVAALALLALPFSCKTLTERTDMLATSVVRDLAQPVVARHDAWVTVDPTLLEEDRDALLAQSEQVMLALDSAGEQVLVTQLLPDLPAILDRHDGYVSVKVLDAIDASDYLRSSDLLRKLLEQAIKGLPAY